MRYEAAYKRLTRLDGDKTRDTLAEALRAASNDTEVKERSFMTPIEAGALALYRQRLSGPIAAAFVVPIQPQGAAAFGARG